MFKWIELAIRLGKLEARVEALEGKRRQVPAEPETAAEELTESDRKMMEGLENIMSFQWPPRKDGDT